MSINIFFENVGINVGANVGVNLNKNEKQIIELILNDPTLTAEKISIKINKAKRTTEIYLKVLQEKGYIERNGLDKSGYGKIKK